jgi:hypothetical protein
MLTNRQPSKRPHHTIPSIVPKDIHNIRPPVSLTEDTGLAAETTASDGSNEIYHILLERGRGWMAAGENAVLLGGGK